MVKGLSESGHTDTYYIELAWHFSCLYLHVGMYIEPMTGKVKLTYLNKKDTCFTFEFWHGNKEKCIILFPTAQAVCREKLPNQVFSRFSAN